MFAELNPFRGRMQKLPTDLEIYKEIYNRYYDTFVQFSRDAPTRQVKNYVPIDTRMIAKRLKVDHDIVFGRLYHVHRRKHRYLEDNKTGGKDWVLFFDVIGDQGYSIHFPLMAAVLAELRKEEIIHKRTIRIAVISAGVSLLGALISLLGLFFAGSS